MYSIHAYYLAALTMAFVLVWFYPVIVGAITFYLIEFPSEGIQSLLDYIIILALTCLGGSFFGFALGCYIRNEMAATQVCSLCITVINLGAGCFANAGSDANFTTKILTHISPNRFSAELAMRMIT